MKNEKQREEYSAPEVQVVLFEEVSDVICTSQSAFETPKFP